MNVHPPSRVWGSFSQQGGCFAVTLMWRLFFFRVNQTSSHHRRPLRKGKRGRALPAMVAGEKPVTAAVCDSLTMTGLIPTNRSPGMRASPGINQKASGRVECKTEYFFGFQTPKDPFFSHPSFQVYPDTWTLFRSWYSSHIHYMLMQYKMQ